MGVKTFAAISVGSYEISMKIFEFSKERMKEIDYIRHRIELGTDTYATGRLSLEKVEELCRVLKEFAKIKKSYRVDAYKAYGTSAIREMTNRDVILDEIKMRTGIRIEVLSNSEQRFMNYKSLASLGDFFSSVIRQSTAVVDIGGGSIQISLYNKDTLVTTQNLKIGILRMRDQLSPLNLKASRYEEVARELIDSQLGMFLKYYLHDKKIDNLIVVDDYISDIVMKKKFNEKNTGQMTKEMFLQFYTKYNEPSIREYKEYAEYEERKPLLFLSFLLVKAMVEVFNIKNISIPGVSLSDGIAYQYGERCHLIPLQHDFEQDIIACARNISERYKGSKNQADTIWKIASSMYDTLKKVHGMGNRERVLLQIAVILHDCGKYVNTANDGECSYSIIMSTEIIGLSHIEREMVANIVRYSQNDFPSYEEINRTTGMQLYHYLTMVKCCAILQISRGLARSHKQKYKQVQTNLKDNMLEICLYSTQDLSLEVGLLTKRIHFFEDVYSLKPVIHTERIKGK